MKKFLLPLLVAYRAFAYSPEEDILVIENFLPKEEQEILTQFYDLAKNGNFSSHLDNVYPLQSVTDPQIRKIFHRISTSLLRLIHTQYHPKKQQQLDFCGFFGRTPGNYAEYHSDNIRFECPIHGINQEYLRRHCDGLCPGAKFVPNHTPWRTYTGLVYLNDDFEGGELVFEDGPQNKKYQKTIQIKAGMLVLSPDGSDFYHEVRTITKGIRRSLNFWFTDNPQYFYRWPNS